MTDNNIYPSSSPNLNTNNSITNIKINTLTIIIAAIFIILTIIFCFLLSFYTKYYWRSRSTRHGTNVIVTTDINPTLPTRGLDPSILSSIPITIYKPSDFKDGFECAVCLSEFAVDEEARVLPKCRHGFHRECIDMWFQSHSTCPVCRCVVEDGGGNQLGESVGLPSDQEENLGSSGLNERGLMISIPIREGFFSSNVSPLSSSRDKRSVVTPKMWPLRNILGKKTGACSSSSSPRIGDIEEGLKRFGAENGEGS